MVGAVASAVVVGLSISSAAVRPNGIVYDALTALRAGPPSEDIVIVGIDNDSVTALGQWPWPRHIHAQLLDRLAQIKPAAVGYDVLFTEPTAPADDAALAAAVAREGKVCLPMAVDPHGGQNGGARTLDPLPALQAGAFGTGQVNLTNDADGVVRRAPLRVHAGDRSWPHMALCLLKAAGKTAMPSGDFVQIDYRGGAGHFRSVPVISVLRGEVPSRMLEGKIVLVGMTADGQGDRYAAPGAMDTALIPGVEIQAALVDTLLRGGGIVVAPVWAVAALSLAALWAFMSGALLLRPSWSLLLGLGLAVAVFAATTIAFAMGVWLRPLAAICGLFLALPLWSWRRLAAASAYMSEELEIFLRDDSIRPPPYRRGDVVARQMATMSAAVAAFRLAQRQRAEALSFLSHDMRAPQVSILTLLRSKHDRDDPAFERRIADNAQRTLDLAESYVQLAKAQVQSLADEVFDIGQAVIDAADALWPVAQSIGVKLVTPDHEDELLVRGDRPLITRALINLIDNALKYGPPGGTVTCTVGSDTDACRIVIADQGPGMTAEAFARLQQPFAQAHPEGEGAGLGLAFVATAVARHGGKLSLREDEGAAFEIVLPRVAGEAQDA